MESDAIKVIRQAEGQVYRTKDGHFFYLAYINLCDEQTDNPLASKPACVLVDLQRNRQDFPDWDIRPLDALYDLQERVQIESLPVGSRIILTNFIKGYRRPSEEFQEKCRSKEGRLEKATEESQVVQIARATGGDHV